MKGSTPPTASDLRERAEAFMEKWRLPGSVKALADELERAEVETRQVVQDLILTAVYDGVRGAFDEMRRQGNEFITEADILGNIDDAIISALASSQKAAPMPPVCPGCGEPVQLSGTFSTDAAQQRLRDPFGKSDTTDWWHSGCAAKAFPVAPTPPTASTEII